jgi:hypothetical protein
MRKGILNKIGFYFSLLLVLSFGFFPLSKIQSAVTMTVDDPTDTVADNGLCSITEALRNGENGDQSGSIDCPAGDASHTILEITTDIDLSSEWPFSIDYGYYLAGGTDITLNGNNHTISANPLNNRGIWRLVGYLNYEFNNITFTGGNADAGLDNKGGVFAIYAANTVTLNNVTFDTNAAADGGALFIRKDSAPTTTVNINDSRFVGNITTNSGGAIYAIDSILYISDTTFENNKSNGGGEGGNIYLLRSNAEIYNSYIEGDGIPNGVINGGGIFSDSNTSKQLKLSSSTFDSLYSGAGGSAVSINSNISVEIVNSTFFQNIGPSSSAISFDGTGNSASISYSTFVGNSPGSGPSDIESADIQTSVVVENNIFTGSGTGDVCGGDLTNFTFTNNISDTDDVDCFLTNSSPTGISSILSLSGGLVKTISLASLSSAIDSGVLGTLGCPAEDARGYPRPYGSSCDVGAYEFTGDVSFILSESGGNTLVGEDGATDSYSINLGQGPTDNVVINISESDSDFEVSPSSITFTPLNWFTSQTITVSAVDNSSDDGDRVRTISHSVSTADVSYSLISPSDVSVSVLDNDEPSSGGSSSGSSVTIVNPTPINPPAPEIFPGCTNPLALNFNPSANQSDGSCTFPVPEIGCMDSSALNYNPDADVPGFCQYQPAVLGCTNSMAINYNSSANEDDGSCQFLDEEDLPTEDDVEIEDNNSINDDVSVIEDGDINNLKDSLNFYVLGISNFVNASKDTVVAVATLGAVLPIVSILVSNPATALSFPIRIWNLIPTLLGFKRRRRPWGTVYDSVTKQPLDPVHVTLLDESGKEVATTITDLDGRFGFLVPAGKYKISVKKTDYVFPSIKMTGKNTDELYADLYFGEEIYINGEEDLVIKNIPMDAVKFNWNEFEKKNKGLLRFYSKFDLFLAKLSSILFFAGFVMSLVMIFFSSLLINYILAGFYVFVLILRFLGVRVKSPGYVFDKVGNPLSFGLVKVFSSSLNHEIAHGVIGKTGKYYILTPNGNYYIKVFNKTGEDNYQYLYTSESFNVKEGYIKKKIMVK